MRYPAPALCLDIVMAIKQYTGGELMATNTPHPIGGSTLEVLAQWLSARATIVLALLMVQVGLMLALFNLYNASTSHSGVSATRGGEGFSCGRYEVVFAPAVNVLAVRQWALNFDAQIVAGPNARGAFELQVPQLDEAQVQQAMGTMASEVRSNPLCPSPGAK